MSDSALPETYPEVEVTLSIPQPSETTDMKKAEKKELWAKKTVTAEAPETEVELHMRDHPLYTVESEIRDLAEELGGMVMSIDHGAGLKPRPVVSVRIPRSGFEDFLEGLSLLGVLESPVPEVPPGEQPALLVRITITE